MLKELSKSLAADLGIVEAPEAYEILQKRMNSFLQGKGDRRIVLMEFDKSEYGILFAPEGKIQALTMEKEELRKVMGSLIEESEAKEVGKPKRHTQVDSKTNRPVPGSYSECRRYLKPNSDLIFKVTEKKENGIVVSGWVELEAVRLFDYNSSNFRPKSKR